MASLLLLPFLKAGLTLAFVQSEGILPAESDFSNNKLDDWCDSLSKFVQDYRLFPCWPRALSGMRLESSLRIPCRSMLIPGVLG